MWGKTLIYSDIRSVYLLVIHNRDEELYDYKFFCFNGKVKFFKIDFGRFIEHHANYYDIDGNLLPFGEAAFCPQPNANIQISSTLKEMGKYAERISAGHAFLRVDFYSVNDKVYFGETTFFPASGLGRIIPDGWDEKIGSWLKLPCDKE